MKRRRSDRNPGNKFEFIFRSTLKSSIFFVWDLGKKTRKIFFKNKNLKIWNFFFKKSDSEKNTHFLHKSSKKNLSENFPAKTILILSQQQKYCSLEIFSDFFSFKWKLEKKFLLKIFDIFFSPLKIRKNYFWNKLTFKSEMKVFFKTLLIFVLKDNIFRFFGRTSEYSNFSRKNFLNFIFSDFYFKIFLYWLF